MNTDWTSKESSFGAFLLVTIFCIAPITPMIGKVFVVKLFVKYILHTFLALSNLNLKYLLIFCVYISCLVFYMMLITINHSQLEKPDLEALCQTKDKIIRARTTESQQQAEIIQHQKSQIEQLEVRVSSAYVLACLIMTSETICKWESPDIISCHTVNLEFFL